MKERTRAYRAVLWETSVVGVLLFIFANSLTPASVSGEESGALFSFLHQFLSFLTHHGVRKVAHFCEYALLGAHLAFAPLLLPWGSRVGTLVALFFGVFVAALDEAFQLFTPGRAGMLTDVLLDCAGYFFGLLLFVFVFFVISRQKRGQKSA